MGSSKSATHPLTQKLVKRACDPCKVRKIKCSEVHPCQACISAGVKCTFTKAQAIRGPKNLRPRTIERIIQQQNPVERRKDEQTKFLELLDVFATRLYPIWPIIDAEQLAASLVTEPRDEKAYHLAKAAALATIAQLKLPPVSDWDVAEVEADAQKGTGILIDSLRVSFFLHIYYENQIVGGHKSLLYLREAITKAQILRMDRESSYAALNMSDQQLHRRILWLLFVTERGVAMLHKLPIILKPNIMFPWYGRTDDRTHILPAFIKLVHLFWVFDQSGIFELLRNLDSDTSNIESLARGCLELLQKKLRDSIDFDDADANAVQRADIFVTRQWMRAFLWRAARRFGMTGPDDDPVDVASEFLSQVGQMPKVALESQGPTLEFKTFEIATAVIDVVRGADSSTNLGRSREVLRGLQRILSSSRGGNAALLSMLNTRLASAAPDLRLLSQPCSSLGETSGLLCSPNAHKPLEPDSTRSLSLGILPEVASTMTDGLDNHSFAHQTAQMSWLPLDFGSRMRSPSPMMQMLFENADIVVEHDL